MDFYHQPRVPTNSPHRLSHGLPVRSRPKQLITMSGLSHKSYFILEKVVVVAVSLAMLGAVYYCVSPMFLGPDPEGPILFSAEGRWAALAAMAGLILLAGFVSGLTTVASRMSGVMLVGLIAAGGVMLRSPGMQTFLWSWTHSMRSLYLYQALDLAVLAVAILVAEWISSQTHSLMRRWFHLARWQPVRSRMCDAQREKIGELPMPLEIGDAAQPSLLSHWLGRSGSLLDGEEIRQQRQATWTCWVIAMAAGITITAILLRSESRSQAAFSLYVGFLLASWWGRHYAWTPSIWAAWSAPLCGGVLMYLLAAATGGQNTMFHLLPIDWATAGVAGSLAGFWVDGRSRENNMIEALATCP